jgi:hypothetical protein
MRIIARKNIVAYFTTHPLTRALTSLIHGDAVGRLSARA